MVNISKNILKNLSYKKAIFILVLVSAYVFPIRWLIADENPHMAPDGTYVGGDPQMAPDGTYVGGDPQMAPDGTYVGDKPQLAPDGASYVGGTPEMAADGTWTGIDSSKDSEKSTESDENA